MFVVLITDMVFLSVCGKNINLKAGDSVFVDLDRMIAYADGVHFDIECTDFTHSH